MMLNKKLAFGSECLTSRHPRHRILGPPGSSSFSEGHSKVWMSREICLPLSKVLDLWSNILESFYSSRITQIYRTLRWSKSSVMVSINHYDLSLDARVRVLHSPSFWIMPCWLLDHRSQRSRGGTRHRTQLCEHSHARAHSPNGGNNNTPKCHCCQSQGKSSHRWC